MFEGLYELAEKAISLDQQVMTLKIYRRSDFQSTVITMNRIDQLSQGLNSDGDIIGTYAAFTDIISENTVFEFEGQRFEKIAGEPYNFVDTAEFFESFQVAVYADGFTIYANDEKEEGNLQDIYGKNILGLTDENQNKLVEIMLPLFQEEVQRILLK